MEHSALILKFVGGPMLLLAMFGWAGWSFYRDTVRRSKEDDRLAQDMEELARPRD